MSMTSKNMKVHYRTITQLTTSLFLFIACVGSILSSDVAAQPKKATQPKKIAPKQTAPAKKYITWNATYTVTIKGHGEQKGAVQGEPDIKWSIDRSFVGKLQLMGPTPLRSGEKVVPGWESYENYGSKATPPTVKVIIKDRLERFLEGPGEIGTHENKNEVTVWEADTSVAGRSDAASALAVNPETRTYWAVLPVFHPDTKKTVRMSRFAVIDRSEAGYGGLPTHEVTKPIEDQITISDIPMPSGDHLVGSSRGSYLASPKPKEEGDPLPASYPYLIDFPKTCFKPAQPFFQGIEDTKTKVDICIEFALFKAPN